MAMLEFYASPEQAPQIWAIYFLLDCTVKQYILLFFLGILKYGE